MIYRDECKCECHSGGMTHMSACCQERKAQVFMAPMPIPERGLSRDKFSVFLAGSIEMGTATNWQETITRLLSDEDMYIFNPRRDDWDSSWVQSIDNHQFKTQVTWELSSMERASQIVFYFDPETKSPITLLELGFWAASDPDKMLVCCPEGYWRKGNVDVVCERYGVKQYNNIQDMAVAVKDRCRYVQSLPTPRFVF